MAYVYILQCCDGTFYTGSTVDLEKRLWEHENGLGANYTKKKLPVTQILHQEKLIWKLVFEKVGIR